jgi:prevent-host-death family protein
MQVSVAQIKAKFSAIAQQADAGEEVIITTRGKPAYRLLPIVNAPQRSPFPDITALAMQSKPYKNKKRKPSDGEANLPSFVADWRAQNERF